MNNEEKFKNDLKIMTRTYFNASDRLKYELFVIGFLLKTSIIIIILSLSIVLLNSNEKSLLTLAMLMALYIAINMNNYIDIFKSSIRFLNSGNKIKDILRSIENNNISIKDAKERYSIIVDLNENRKEIDRLIALECDNILIQKLLKKLHIKTCAKYIIPFISILGVVSLLNLYK